MSAAALIERARQALFELNSAKECARRERDKLAEMKLTQQREQAERERLRADKLKDDALRLIDGEDIVPKRPRRDSRLAKLDESAPAQEAAIRLQEVRVADAEAAAAGPQVPFVAAVLDVTVDVQGDAIDSARATLRELAPAFARLIAADQIRAATLGERFPMPPGSTPPFSGLTIIRNFAKAIPDRLRPPELAEQRLLDDAHAISSEIISQIKGI